MSLDLCLCWELCRVFIDLVRVATSQLSSFTLLLKILIFGNLVLVPLILLSIVCSLMANELYFVPGICFLLTLFMSLGLASIVF